MLGCLVLQPFFEKLPCPTRSVEKSLTLLLNSLWQHVGVFTRCSLGEWHSIGFDTCLTHLLAHAEWLVPPLANGVLRQGLLLLEGLKERQQA